MAKEAIEIYDRTYFEDGLAVGKSLYNGFRWMPERSCQEAMAIIDCLNIDKEQTVLDFGCAKGFLVKALRLLGREAYGCDVSRYAVCTADTSVRQFIRLCTPEIPFPFKRCFNVVLAKDVLEHLDVTELYDFLHYMNKHCSALFVAVPIGDGKRFHVPEYNYDATHKIAQTPDWWKKVFQEHGFDLDWEMVYMPGMKDNWNHYENGNRFFILRSIGNGVD